MASRWLESLVFGVSARSGATMATAAAAVIGMAVIAAAIPAWRAMQVDAVDRLRHL
jgi:ABC-type antimicrobial peptide transport system permease subunit